LKKHLLSGGVFFNFLCFVIGLIENFTSSIQILNRLPDIQVLVNEVQFEEWIMSARLILVLFIINKNSLLKNANRYQIL